jgi:hypothetical protein
MGIVIVLALALLPAMAALVVCLIVLIRAGRDFQQRRPFAFYLTIAAPVICAGPALLILAAVLMGNSKDPAQAYKSLFDVRAPACVTLLLGETQLSADSERARVGFRSACPDMEASLAPFNLAPAPDGKQSSDDDLATLGDARAECRDPTVRVGSKDRWRNIEVISCGTTGLYVVSGFWTG